MENRKSLQCQHFKLFGQISDACKPQAEGSPVSPGLPLARPDTFSLIVELERTVEDCVRAQALPWKCFQLRILLPKSSSAPRGQSVRSGSTAGAKVSKTLCENPDKPLKNKDLSRSSHRFQSCTSRAPGLPFSVHFEALGGPQKKLWKKCQKSQKSLSTFIEKIRLQLHDIRRPPHRPSGPPCVT